VETVVLVLTDVQGSTRLWQDEPVAMDAAMRRHHEIVHGAVEQHEGWRPVDQGEGDAVFAAFRSATAAVDAVSQVQRDLAAEPWPTSIPLKVRIGVHLGEVTEREGNLYGDPVNRCARLRGLASGGQTLLSAPVYEVVRDKLPSGVALSDLGEHRMKDLVRPEHVWQLDLDGLPADFPPLASLDRAMHNLPVQPSALIGREVELAAALTALEAHRLVTLTAFGGMGKTRLALQVAAELADGNGDGVWFVDLASTTDPAAVPGLVGRATGLGGADAESVIDAMTGQRLLLVLDNLEQVMGCATFVADLLARVPGVQVLATSREPLRLRGEQELPLAPLALPPVGGAQDAASLSAYAAVRLFVDRACAARPEFTVTNDNAPAVAAICQRLDGHPLAIELAAARVRMMTPQALLPRLDQALSVLTGGSRDLPGRHQTLRATIAWSYDLLEPDERLLLGRISVFAGPVGFEHVEAVCGQDLDVFDALASLVEKSLVRTTLSDDGEDRYGLLVSIKAYATEQLTTSGTATALQDRHADHMIEQGTLHPPYTAAESLALERRLEELFDELTAAWQHVQTRPDDPRVPNFPSRYFEALYHLTLTTGGLETVLARSTAPTLAHLQALGWHINTLGHSYQQVAEELYTRLHDVAEQLDRPEARAFALLFADQNGLDPQERRDRLDALDALLAQVPADSPLGRDWLLDVRDNAAAVLLQYVDPDLTAAATERRASGVLGGALDHANLAGMRLWQGRWEHVVDLTRDTVAAGVTRQDPEQRHIAVAAAARALVELGHPERALEVLRPWMVEITRRGWRHPREVNSCAQAYALHVLGRPAEAAELFAALPRPLLMPATCLMALRVARLAGQDADPAAASALVGEFEGQRWQVLPLYLSALVEQVLREPSDEARRALLARIEGHPTSLVLGFGYQKDLDRLRAGR